MQFFTQIYVLARGGVTIYAGPPDQLQSTLEDQIGMLLSFQLFWPYYSRNLLELSHCDF